MRVITSFALDAQPAPAAHFTKVKAKVLLVLTTKIVLLRAVRIQIPILLRIVLLRAVRIQTPILLRIVLLKAVRIQTPTRPREACAHKRNAQRNAQSNPHQKALRHCKIDLISNNLQPTQLSNKERGL